MLSNDRLTRRMFVERAVELGAALGFLSACAHAGPSGPAIVEPAEPGLPARAELRVSELSIGNEAIEGRWSTADGALRARSVLDRASNVPLPLAESAFVITLEDGRRILAAEMRIVAGPRVESLVGNPKASRVAERLHGREATVELEDAERRFHVIWRAVLRDGSRYLRQEITVRPLGEAVAVRDITLVDINLVGAEVTGTVKGSPVAGGNWYAAVEHPLATSVVEGVRVRCTVPVRAGAQVTVSSVIGLVRTGQRRRDFLAYVERERAHPYRTFLHYNSWYDIGYFSKYSESDALAVIDAFGAELARKRGITLNSFLFDDGWDDPKTLWGFHAGFPDGFTKLRQAAAAFGAGIGVWMSPWGGYGQPKKDRLDFGRAQGFETNRDGFALSGPKYFERFRATCLRMAGEFGVNQFKIDGTGNAANTIPGSAFDNDFEAALALIAELRAGKPDLYVNLTTGTYPSPFWLRHADSIWRGGEDHDFAGVGTKRQQWITYRDADTFANVVKRGSLFPLNALMLHGMIYARHAKNLDTDPAGDFDAEVRSYFGTGTQLQEMYVTPSLLTPANWDVIAESAAWSRWHAPTLVDTHWIGGDPAKLEPYGWAVWSSRGGIVTLRNPGDKPATFALDAGAAFELPASAPKQYSARSPWARDRGRAPLLLQSGVVQPITLAPFEVLTLNAEPGTT